MTGDQLDQETLAVGDVRVDAALLNVLLTTLLERFAPDTPVTLRFKRAHFASGHDLQDFAAKLGLELAQTDVEQ